MADLVIDEKLVRTALGCLSNANCIERMRCPNSDCLSTAGFYIEGHIWSDDGCFTNNDDWTNTSRCECFLCRHIGEVRDFEEPDVTTAHIKTAENLLNWMKDGHYNVTEQEETRLVAEQMPAAIYRTAYLLALAEWKGQLLRKRDTMLC